MISDPNTACVTRVGKELPFPLQSRPKRKLVYVRHASELDFSRLWRCVTWGLDLLSRKPGILNISQHTLKGVFSVAAPLPRCKQNHVRFQCKKIVPMPVQFIKDLSTYRAGRERRASCLLLVSLPGKPGNKVGAHLLTVLVTATCTGCDRPELGQHPGRRIIESSSHLPGRDL